ncbi:energy transducer TonB [Leptothoe kymatousa]|uniref:Energy transducer TonB n=1 Tax=Leptothoe kymatousa TAU-MAC 1615 TaxID=2364775 RepID=A0ABS5Y4U2_9CYAN|nr:energy transducer TonB [Leptothoe kymatousa]MBT9312832.1 energy transducer TonB [Leptothoe kymatousa TAU-MAC 1615]
MAKSYLSKLNRWLTPLVLTSIGLHGLVLALPMPRLVEEEPEKTELVEPKVIQVVTLPKLATGPSDALPLPEPPEEAPLELPPEGPPTEVAIVEEIIVTEPEILEYLEPEPETEPEPAVGQLPEEDNTLPPPEPPTLDDRIATRDSYSNFDGTRMGNGVTTNRLTEIFQQTGSFPLPLRALEGTLSSIVVPLQDCLPDQPGDAVSVMVNVDADGALMGDPQLLNSTGYEVLDAKALEMAQAADYAPHHTPGEPKGYTFNIKVDYEACNVAALLRYRA